MKLHFIRGDFMIREELDRLLCDAKSNAELKEKLLKTEQSENPIDNFCSLCRSHCEAWCRFRQVRVQKVRLH